MYSLLYISHAPVSKVTDINSVQHWSKVIFIYLFYRASLMSNIKHPRNKLVYRSRSIVIPFKSRHYCNAVNSHITVCVCCYILRREIPLRLSDLVLSWIHNQTPRLCGRVPGIHKYHTFYLYRKKPRTYSVWTPMLLATHTQCHACFEMCQSTIYTASSPVHPVLQCCSTQVCPRPYFLWIFETRSFKVSVLLHQRNHGNQSSHQNDLKVLEREEEKYIFIKLPKYMAT